MGRLRGRALKKCEVVDKRALGEVSRESYLQKGTPGKEVIPRLFSCGLTNSLW